MTTRSSPDFIPTYDQVSPGDSWLVWRFEPVELTNGILTVGELTPNGPQVKTYDVSGLSVDITRYSETAVQIILTREATN